jgi:hypothetical protein
LGGQPVCDNNDDFNSSIKSENRQPLTTFNIEGKAKDDPWQTTNLKYYT